MLPYGFVFVIAVTIGFAATLVVRAVARRAGVVDRADGFRKTQKDAIPLLGGVAVFVAFWGSMLACRGVSWRSGLAIFLGNGDTWFMLGGAAAVLLLGLIDDVWGLRARWKLLGTFLVSLAMYAWGYRIGAIGNPFGEAIELGWLALPVTVFWFMGCMHALNLIDGLDGLATGVTIFAAATVFLAGMMFGNAGASFLAAALAGSCLGFLLLNFHPASIYLGDCGSLLLGFLLACIGLRGAQKSQMVVALLIPVIAFGLPIMDTSLAVLRRWLKSVPFVYSDRQHIHHKLLEMGLSHRGALLVMYAGCVVLAAFALLMTAEKSLGGAGVLLVLGVATFMTVRVFGRHELMLLKDRFTGHFEGRRRLTRCRAAGYVASASMRQAETVDGVWQLFATAAQRMELERAEMALLARDGSGRQAQQFYLWADDGNGRGLHDDDILWSGVFPLHIDGARLGNLRVTKATNGHSLGPEIAETLELLSKALAINVARVQNATHYAQPLYQSTLF